MECFPLVALTHAGQVSQQIPDQQPVGRRADHQELDLGEVRPVGLFRGHGTGSTSADASSRPGPSTRYELAVPATAPLLASRDARI